MRTSSLAVTDPEEIVGRTTESRKRAFYYYENWESLYARIPEFFWFLGPRSTTSCDLCTVG